jgi:hypothetical protein
MSTELLDGIIKTLGGPRRKRTKPVRRYVVALVSKQTGEVVGYHAPNPLLHRITTPHLQHALRMRQSQAERFAGLFNTRGRTDLRAEVQERPV